MGHVRVGRLPKRWGWEAVVSALSTQDLTDESLVSAAARAANRTLSASKYQESVALAYWTFLDLAAASRTGSLLTHLHDRGLTVPERATGLTLLKLISTMVEKDIRAKGVGTALDEIAIQTFDAVVLGTVRDASKTLFGCTVETVQETFRSLSTKSNVASLGRQFFSEYTYRALRLPLEKELARSLSTDGKFRTSTDLSRFQERLRGYCWDVSKIVEDYSGGWYSKAVWEERLTLEEAQKFTSYAIEKLLSELTREKARL